MKKLSRPRSRRRGRLGAAPALLAALALLPAAGCGGGGGPTGPDPVDIGSNQPGVGWAFGDSLSHGRDSLYSYRVMPLDDAGADEPGYRLRLEQDLLADGRTVRIVEDGEPGTYSADGLGRVGRAVRGRPAFLVLLYGSNDAYVGLSVDQLTGNLRYMIDEFRRNKIIVVLCTLPPICDFAGPLPRLDAYNDAIRALGAGYAGDGGVLLADLNKAFEERGGGDVCHLLNPVGIHPTREGYELMADTVFEQLSQVAW